ncbi:hypothetical protein KY339_01910 [Candidatus Woesearchaeota archaeon]|nr:hypothetical protein [Candidatus Woesearchaeota archaeon]
MHNKSTEYTENTKSTESTKSTTTTIRIKDSTKEKLANLDFVKKDTYDEILLKLMEYYEEQKKREHGSGKNK